MRPLSPSQRDRQEASDRRGCDCARDRGVPVGHRAGDRARVRQDGPFSPLPRAGSGARRWGTPVASCVAGLAPDARPLDRGKPRDEDTEGGNQSADKSLINRRLKLRSQLCAAKAFLADGLSAERPLNRADPLDREHKRLAETGLRSSRSSRVRFDLGLTRQEVQRTRTIAALPSATKEAARQAGADGETGQQPDEWIEPKALALSASPEVFGEGESGEPMPAGGLEGQETVPASRRSRGKRRPAR